MPRTPHPTPPRTPPHPSHHALFVSRLSRTLGDRSLSSRQRRRRLRRLGTDQSVSTSQPLHKRRRADNLGPSARIAPIADSTATLSGACQAEERRGVLQICPLQEWWSLESGLSCYRPFLVPDVIVGNQAFPASDLSLYQTSLSVTRPFLLQIFPATGLSCYQTSVSVTKPFLLQTFPATGLSCYQTSVPVTRPFLLPDVSVGNPAFFLLLPDVSVGNQAFPATTYQCW